MTINSTDDAERMWDEIEVRVIDEIERFMLTLGIKEGLTQATVRAIYLNSRDASDFGCTGEPH